MSFRILSLNGGGIRGLFQAVYLKEVAKQLGEPLHKSFELIAGTSTGALIALGLALGIPIQNLAELFSKHGDRIFGKKKAFSGFRKGASYLAGPLRETLLEIYGDRRLRDCERPVVICSTVLNEYRHRVFTTLPRCGGKTEDSDLLVADVAMASCAAPTYFPSFTPSGQARTYVDGGLWANSPSLVAVIAAHVEMGQPFQDIRLVSLGNGEFPSGIDPEKYDSAGPTSKVRNILELMFSSQSAAADDFAEKLIGSANILRLNIQLQEPMELDDAKNASKILVPRAEQAARNESRLKPFLS